MVGNALTELGTMSVSVQETGVAGTVNLGLQCCSRLSLASSMTVAMVCAWCHRVKWSMCASVHQGIQVRSKNPESLCYFN